MRIVCVLSACALAVCACETPTEPCKSVQDLTPSGPNITGSIAAEDCADPDGNVGDGYRFTVAAGARRLEFALTSSGFDGAVALWAGDITLSHAPLIFYGTGSLLFGEPVRWGPLRVWLPAGTYTLFVTSDDGKRGSYTLTSRTETFDGCGGEIWTTTGHTIAGMLTTDDCKPATSSAWFDRYAILLSKGQSVNLHLTIPPSWIGVHGPSGVVLQQAVPGGGGDISFTASTAGEYHIELLAEVDRFAPPVVSYTMRIQ